MKFYSENTWLPENGAHSKKTYMCTSCFYKRVIIDGSSGVEVLEGDKEFIIFPFASFTKLDGTHVELCACPKCGTIQIIERTDEPKDVEHLLS